MGYHVSERASTDAMAFEAERLRKPVATRAAAGMPQEALRDATAHEQGSQPYLEGLAEANRHDSP